MSEQDKKSDKKKESQKPAGPPPPPVVATTLARVLRPDELYRKVPEEWLDFKSTAELETLSGVIEQDRAIRALEIGISIDKRNYNVYVAGASGTGKTTMVKSMLEKVAPKRATPPDWICVNNFKDPSAPLSVSMQPGTAAEFKRRVADIITHLREQVPKVFHSKEHQEKVQGILNSSLDRENECFLELSRVAKDVGFTIKSTKTGIVTIPMLEEKIISNKDYAHLTEEERRFIEENRKKLDPHISEFLQKTRDIEVDTHKRIQNIQRELGEAVSGTHFESLRRPFKGKGKRANKQVVAFIDALFEDILENLPKFLPDESDPDQAREQLKKPLKEYEVNVLVDNAEVKGAPVIVETRPTWSNLFGKIERKLENGVYFTDFTLIRAGSLQRASGGFLIVNVLDLFGQPGVWEQLKSCLRNREVSIEDPSFLSPFLPTAGLRPDPIPVQPKIVLHGSAWAYYVLHRVDEDFRKFFQVLCDFDDEIDATAQTVREYAQFVATTCHNDKLLAVDREGIAAVIEEGARLTDHQGRLTLKFNDVANLVIEANHHAKKEKGQKLISRVHVERAIEERTARSSLVADKIQREILEGRTLIDVAGAKVGQINGLAVYGLGELSFGKPSRITVNTFAGRAGIVNIERESKLSGKIHDKGIHIIAGYLGDRYAQHAALSVSVTVCFEQNYGGVDGDSASSTELYAVLSSLAGVPIRQSIAVTGSVNQKGEIQPIGGVNEKVEGFYDVCAAMGLSGEQGCIIPVQNVPNLMLRPRVRDAVAKGQFHLWPVATVEDGLRLLTGVEPGTADASGAYPPGTLHDLVLRRLEQFAKAVAKKS